LHSSRRQGSDSAAPGERGPNRAAFLGRVRSARRRALLVDYDGTIAPLTADRAHAAPYPGMRAALATAALARHRTAIWIVSGRTVAELDRLLGLERLVDLWGSHGMERRSRHGRWSGPLRAPETAAFLATAAEDLERLAGTDLVERKVYGLALHRRGADRAAYGKAEAELVGEIAPRAEGHGLALAAFDGGLELRPRGFHKGLVIERAFAELGAEAAVAYLGDDATDEDAFAALAGRGLSVLVRAGPRPTRADVRLRPPEEVLDFLEAWAAACQVGVS